MKTQNYLLSSKILFGVIALCFFNIQISKAQYHPLLQSNKYWGEELRDGNINSFCLIVQGIKLFVYGDTIINATTYKTFGAYRLRDAFGFQISCPPFYFDTILVFPCHFWYGSNPLILREDTLTQKVYTVFLDTATQIIYEKLVYDFNANVGDTLVMYPPTISSLAMDAMSIVIKTKGVYTAPSGELLKYFEYYFSGTPSFLSMKYYEGIGSELGMIYGLSNKTCIGCSSLLTCVNENGNQLYNHSSIGALSGCYSTVGINDVPKPNQLFTASPNPTNGLFILQKEFHFDELKIYNCYGTAIAFSISNKNEIDISTQPTGLYFVKATDGTKFFVIRVLKN